VAALSAVATSNGDDGDEKESYKQQVARKHGDCESFSDEEGDHVAAILALTGDSVSVDDASGKFATGSSDDFMYKLEIVPDMLQRLYPAGGI
jgi:hypothetical protein